MLGFRDGRFNRVGIPPPTRGQLVAQAFHTWEIRGRGWQLYDTPVELEPAFLPFRIESALPSIYDDGLRPRVLEEILKSIGALFGQSRISETGEGEAEPFPRLWEASGHPLVVFRLASPLGMTTSRETAEHFLLGLPAGLGILSFEILGTLDSIKFQIVCDELDAPKVQNSLRAFFPEMAVVRLGDDDIGWTADRESLVIDFGLSREFMLPLICPRRFDLDPLTGILAAMENLEVGESALWQILLSPVRQPWSEHALRALHHPKGKPIFLDGQDLARLGKQKLSQPLYATVVRLGVQSPTLTRAWAVAQGVLGGLASLGSPLQNELIPLSNEDYPDPDHEEDLLLRRSRRSGMLLSIEELATLVHPPSDSIRSEKLHRLVRKTKAASANSRGHDFVLGANNHAGQSFEVTLSPEQRFRHLYLIGASGTGKSTLLLQSIVQDLEKGRGLAVLDPHGDLIDQILGRIPKHRMDDVVLIDPGDTDYSVGLNILSAHSDLEKTLLASDLVSVFERLSTSWGDQMTSVLGNAILAFLESDRGGTLLDLRRFLVEKSFREDFLLTVRDPEVIYYWRKEFPLLAGKPQAPLLTRLDTFLRPKPIRYMVAQNRTNLDFTRIMNEGKILLARLSQGAIGEENAYLLGTLLVSKLQQVAMSRQELAESERRPFYLYIDEFQNFVTPSMAQILSGARKYRLGLILAHQDLRQLSSKSADVLSAVLTNPCTRICFRVGDQDARVLAEGFASFNSKDLQSLGVGQAIARIERADGDFSLDTKAVSPIDPLLAESRRQEVIQKSRVKYARPLQEIEAELRGAEREDQSLDVRAPFPVPRPAISVAPVFSSPRPNEIVRAVSPPHRVLTLSAGRGGQEHKRLQEFIKQWAEANGWRATIEELVPEGLGKVDVALRKGSRAIACEISVTTEPRHELGNIQKCLAAGFERIILVSANKRTLQRTQKLISGLAGGEQQRILLATPKEIYDVLTAVDKEGQTTERTIRGYRVRTSGQPAEGTKQKVAQVIAKALRRKRGKDKSLGQASEEIPSPK